MNINQTFKMMHKTLYRKVIAASLLLNLAAFPAAATAAPPQKETMIILSFDGMRHDYAEKYIKDGSMPHLKKLKKEGMYAKDITTVNPSLTAASHASIATGAKPEKTGFVSNEFHYSGKKLNKTKNAFQANIDVAPLWKEAKKQGKVTAVIGFPGSNPQKENEADYSIYYGDVLAESSYNKLDFKPVKKWDNPPKSFSEPQEAHLKIKLQGKKDVYIHILAIDSSDNNKKDYDRFHVSEDLTVDSQDASVQLNKWGQLPLQVKGADSAGFLFKLKGSKKDLSSVKFYRTAVTTGLIKGPEGFKEKIVERFGFFPDQDDLPAFEKGWISRKEYEEINENFADWLADTSLFIKKEYKPDLLMFYEPHIDLEEHEFLLTDPRQPGYSQEAVKTYESYIKWAYENADDTIGKTSAAMTENDRLFIVSDHGMEPIHSRISPNYELKKAGLLKLNKKGEVDLSNSKAYAVASGTIAHVYINLKGREKDGIVDPKDYEKVQNEIVRTFKGIKDERKLASRKKLLKHHYNEWRDRAGENGLTWQETKDMVNSMFHVIQDKKENPYEKITESDQKEANNFDHRNAGDVILAAAPGYIIGKDAKKAIEPTKELGSHGGDPKRKELRPVFYAYGKDISHGEIERHVSTLDIAPTVYRLMNLRTPSFIDGKPIKELLK
ncbi:nucleotide pyrophosphatase [Bacillus aerolatus]|uniref:Nucleotide pyrophosphatase n=1 Tax=Bacillus aerolatus TaxID=2653354 RepID=A0A6I1FHQ6_9BACI|nr:alkaline phosphatase family protein [Bacillus aerolatus]KAB7705347.1 nucleotide pyrophosphatase [Bacillus aerolatus]